MRAVLVALVVAACVAVSVDAHAKLTSPVPWNAQPSKTNPCGGGAATAVQATYAPGATIKLGWTVVAGDGNGPVTVSWDKNGGTTFTNPTVAASSPADPIVNTGPYTLTVTIPDGIVGDKVTLQAKSSTNWYACATVAVKAATSPTGGSQGSVASSTGAAGSADTQVCRPAPSALPFCTGLTGEIEISSSPALQNMGDVDTALKGVYLFNINSTKVFQHASTSGCADAYKKYVCANEFPLCGTAAKGGGCRSQCFKFAELCGLDDSHASLYPCNDNQVLEKDSMGMCEACNGACALGLNGASSSAAPLSALALLGAAVAAAVAARRA